MEPAVGPAVGPGFRGEVAEEATSYSSFDIIIESGATILFLVGLTFLLR